MKLRKQEKLKRGLAPAPISKKKTCAKTKKGGEKGKE